MSLGKTARNVPILTGRDVAMHRVADDRDGDDAGDGDQNRDGKSFARGEGAATGHRKVSRQEA